MAWFDPAEHAILVIMASQGRYIAVEEIRPLPHHRLWLAFNDGASGEVDVSDFLDHPQFGRWADEDFLQERPPSTLAARFWDEIIDLSPRMLYRRLTGCRPCDINPSGQAEAMSALKTASPRTLWQSGGMTSSA